ncbi:MAG: 50S ribosomal protein L9 [Parcubacteria group bacterium]|jgi:large subunit ribosomal protein L9
MKVILLQNVADLGKEGEVREVSNGYARNFLIPKKLAEAATEESVKRVESEKVKIAESARMELEEAQKLAELLEGREVYIKVKEKNGKLFGSVNEKTIAKTLKEEGIKIDPSSIKLSDPVKEVGEYDVSVGLEHGLEANLRIILVSEEI